MASVGTIKYKNGSSWIDILHPVGSVWISHQSDSPATLFGGTWTQITDAALRASTSIGYTGSDTHTITINEIPSHRHDINDSITDDGTPNGHWKLLWGNHNNKNGNIYTSYVGGGASNVACPAFLQLLYLVQNCVDSLAVM